MNGAESLMHTARQAGISVCFANPGTTELQLVAALDTVPGMRAVLGLFEGVCTGAADGYARMTGTPALTLLHLGPGFANGIANLHNARRAGSAVVNLIGDHATWHREADAPLTSDIESLARPVSAWVHSSRTAAALGADLARAVGVALHPPGQVATLIVPQDCAWDAAPAPAPLAPRPQPARVATERLAAAADALRRAGVALLLGGPALRESGLCAAARIAAATGCAVFQETFAARLESGGGLPSFPRLPYFPEQVLEALANVTTLVLAGARAPVSFFGYPGKPSLLTPAGATTLTLADAGEDVLHALAALADMLGAPADVALPARERPTPPSGELNPFTLGQALAALQPEGAIVVDEAATSGVAYQAMAPAAPRHTILSLTGGAIGQGLPCAVGAAVACPDRKVIAFQADGSGLYTLQALWTMARESLDVTVVVCANRLYRILQFELMRAGIAEPGPHAQALTELSRPTIDWVALAQGLGVPAERVDTADAAVAALHRALAAPGPALIEAVL